MDPGWFCTVCLDNLTLTVRGKVYQSVCVVCRSPPTQYMACSGERTCRRYVCPRQSTMETVFTVLVPHTRAWMTRQITSISASQCDVPHTNCWLTRPRQCALDWSHYKKCTGFGQNRLWTGPVQNQYLDWFKL